MLSTEGVSASAVGADQKNSFTANATRTITTLRPRMDRADLHAVVRKSPTNASSSRRPGRPQPPVVISPEGAGRDFQILHQAAVGDVAVVGA